MDGMGSLLYSNKINRPKSIWLPQKDKPDFPPSLPQ